MARREERTKNERRTNEEQTKSGETNTKRNDKKGRTNERTNETKKRKKTTKKTTTIGDAADSLLTSESVDATPSPRRCSAVTVAPSLCDDDDDDDMCIDVDEAGECK